MSLTLKGQIQDVFRSNLHPIHGGTLKDAQKLTKLGRCCMQNNQLPTKSHFELEDNSNVLQESI